MQEIGDPFVASYGLVAMRRLVQAWYTLASTAISVPHFLTRSPTRPFDLRRPVRKASAPRGSLRQHPMGPRRERPAAHPLAQGPPARRKHGPKLRRSDGRIAVEINAARPAFPGARLCHADRLHVDHGLH